MRRRRGTNLALLEAAYRQREVTPEAVEGYAALMGGAAAAREADEAAERGCAGDGCRLCSGEACRKCGAGMTNFGPCEHDCSARHEGAA